MVNQPFTKLKNPALLRSQGYIDGKWVSSQSSQATFDVLNPSTGAIIATLPEMNTSDASLASEAANRAFHKWRKVDAKSRGKIVKKWGELMLSNIDDLATIMTAENGKPYPESRGEITYAASFLEFYSGEAERQYGEIIPSSNPAHRIFTVKQPIGVVACLVPWNFPAGMVTRKAGGAISAGCATVVKPAGETPLTCLALAVLAEEAGIPPGVFNVITTLANLESIGLSICQDKTIRKVSFTGSTRIGKLLMSQCSSTLKKLSMELGGNSPFIFFEDCDPKTSVDAMMHAKMRNSGQTCVCANRIYVQRSVYPQISALIVERFKALKAGDGFAPDSTVGPLTITRGVDKAVAHVKDAQEKGAKVLVGGNKIEGPGYFFEPTVLGDMKPNMLSFAEEVFAPIAPLYVFDTEEEVIRMANDSDVGLGAYVCTENISRMWRVSEELEVGMVGVNTGIISGGEMPFGGVKESGFGKEGGKWGVEEFMITKTIVVRS